MHAVLMANVCKHNVTRFPYDIARIAQDLAGGLMSTMPSDADFRVRVDIICHARIRYVGKHQSCMI